MKPFRFFLITFLTIQFVHVNALELGWVTSEDLQHSDSSSNILLKNSGSQAKTVYGLYLRELFYVTPGDTCDHATQIFPSLGVMLPDITVGSFLSPTTIYPGKSAPVGKNYLYNMIYQSSFYIGIHVPSSPPGCALPGCTWGNDTTIYNWCINLGALSPVSTSTGYVSNVPPNTLEASSSGTYDYNMISTGDYVTLGPISCSDATLTCEVSGQQVQTFR